jgi:type I restriction enzyme S subunit
MSNKVDASNIDPEKQRGLKPGLRFPEFRDRPDWDEIKLIDVTNKKVKWSFIGGPFGSNLKASDYTSNGIRIIQLQNIGDGEFIDDYKIFTSEQKADELLGCNIYPGDIILSKMGDPVARACFIPINNERYVMCSDGIRLVVDEKKYSKFFIYSFINSVHFRSRAEKAATGSTRKRIGLDELKNLSVVVPGLIEQQKIADCLSSLDELITAENQKLDTLKAYKKGMVQQLFPSPEVVQL